MRNHTFCTIVTRSHVRYAVALSKTLGQHHPEAILHVLVVDGGEHDLNIVPGRVYILSDLQGSFSKDMPTYFTAFELANTLKPFFLAFVLDQGFEKAVFLDSDILVLGSMRTLLEALDQSSIVLTPHLLFRDRVGASSISVAQLADLGMFNGGIWGIRGDRLGRLALKWLMDFLPDYGFDEPAKKMFVDQKLLPLIAHFFREGFCSLAHPGYNVAYWNVHERRLTEEGGAILVNGKSIVCFHFSGYDELEPERLSRHSYAFIEPGSLLAQIVEIYRRTLPPASEFPAVEYGFAQVNGIKMTVRQRRYYYMHRSLRGYRMSRIQETIRWIKAELKMLVKDGILSER